MKVFVFTAPICNAATAASVINHLDAAERSRAQSIRSEKRRCEFLSGRLLARQALAGIYGEASSRWVIEVQPGGALVLKGGSHAPMLSLSHSKGLIACAVGETSLLGVDVEQIHARKHLPELAAGVLHPDELAEFSRLGEDSQTRFFYAKWVAKEALGKALGCGINYPMRETLLHDERLLAAPQGWIEAPEKWQFSHTLLPGGYSLGLAWHGDSATSVSIESVEIRL